MKTLSFNFPSLSLVKFSQKSVKTASSWFMAFTKFFIRPSFKCMDVNKILLGSTSDWFSTFWFLDPEIFWQANPFLSNEETELCCPIHKWSSNILWILVVVQVVRQSLLSHQRFAILFIVINGVHQNLHVLIRLLIMHWMTNRNRR